MTNEQIDYRNALRQLAGRAFVLGKAYQLRRESLALPNLLTLVLPAVLSTAAAIVAALPNGPNSPILNMPWASLLAGVAAVLIAIHKALNCEEYQAECLRLAGICQSIEVEASMAGQATSDVEKALSRLSEKMASAIENASATVPNRFIRRAKVVAKENGYALQPHRDR